MHVTRPPAPFSGVRRHAAHATEIESQLHGDCIPDRIGRSRRKSLRPGNPRSAPAAGGLVRRARRTGRHGRRWRKRSTVPGRGPDDTRRRGTGSAAPGRTERVRTCARRGRPAPRTERVGTCARRGRTAPRTERVGGTGRAPGEVARRRGGQSGSAGWDARPERSPGAEADRAGRRDGTRARRGRPASRTPPRETGDGIRGAGGRDRVTGRRRRPRPRRETARGTDTRAARTGRTPRGRRSRPCRDRARRRPAPRGSRAASTRRRRPG